MATVASSTVDIGAHVKGTGGLLATLARAEALGCDVLQLFTQSPRQWRPARHDPEELAAYRAAEVASASIRATFCHATYLVNLAAGQEELAEQSRRTLTDNLATATALGSAGVVLHVGSHRGAGLEAVKNQVVDALRRALDDAEAAASEPTCRLLLENAAGAGGTVGRSFDELAVLLEAADDPRLGICLDTQHLFASGVPYRTIAEADEAVSALDRAVGLDRLACLHLNDSKVPLGANRDRHENLGEGEIGREALACLLGHPSLQEVPAILEVPGDGDGPRAKDVTVARELLAEGLARRAGDRSRHTRSPR